MWAGILILNRQTDAAATHVPAADGHFNANVSTEGDVFVLFFLQFVNFVF